MTDILDLHTHTVMSGHAYNTLYEMLHSASEKGVKLLGVTEHAPGIPGACHPFYFINFRVVPREVYGVKLMLGCELNIIDYDGTVDLKPRFLKGLDFAIASIHEPCYKSGTVAQNTSAYLGAMKNPAVQIIGHPDDSRFPVDYESLVCAAKEHHVLLEVNSSSLHPLCHRQGARENYITMLELCRRHQVSIILDSDAHSEIDVGNHTRAWELVKELDFPEELIVNTSIEKAAAYIPTLRQEIYTEGCYPVQGSETCTGGACHD
ncbi:MAG: phosphatase [Eubacteriales bacterium]|nr:phosphatase [Eubacteriales bacterium]